MTRTSLFQRRNGEATRNYCPKLSSPTVFDPCARFLSSCPTRMYLPPDYIYCYNPLYSRNFLRAGRQEVITLNIHRLRKGEAGVSLIVPLTEIRPSRVISLPVSFPFDPRPMRFDFHSLRKEERERKRKAGGRGKEKKRRESIFRPKLSYTYVHAILTLEISCR